MSGGVYERLEETLGVWVSTALWFASQLGLADAPHAEAHNIQPNDPKIRATGSEPIYLEKTSTIPNSFMFLFLY